MGKHLLTTEKVVTEFKTGDYVESHYNGSRYTGVVGEVNTKWLYAQLRMAPGVDMILPLSTMTHITEEDLDDFDSE